MIQAVRLSHVGLHARDLSKQAEFYNDRWGLDRIEEHKREMFFRGEGPDHHVLSLHGADAPGMHHVALEVATTDEIDRAHEELLALGVQIVTPPTQDLEPGIAKALRFKDPDGNVVELVAGVDKLNEEYGIRDVKPQALNHVVLNVNDLDVSEAFYSNTLGFKLTDKFIGGLSFWACDANHHSLALGKAAPGRPAGMNHAAFDLKDWEAWLKAVFTAGERGIPRLWGPGRHLFGNNLFSYYRDPENNTVEYTAEVEQITDEREPRITDTIVADQWITAQRG